MHTHPYPAFFLAAILFVAFPAAADGLYFGAGAYLTDIEVESVSDDDITPAAFVGYQFLDSNFLMLSVELGYYDLGAASLQIDGERVGVDASALTAAGVAYLPLGPFIEVYGKLGVGAVEVESRFGDLKESDDGSEVFGGVGVAWDIFDTIDIYAEYLQFDNAVDSQMFGVGIRLDLF